jgi:hypothetical protein
VSTLTLKWTTTAVEHHSLALDLESAPEWLQEVIAEGIALDSPWRVMDSEGLVAGIVHTDRAEQIRDSIDGYLAESEDEDLTLQKNVDITSRILNIWSVTP